MKNNKSDARALAASIIHDIVTNDTYVKYSLSKALDASKLDQRDRSFCTELVYGTLRYYNPLKKSISRALTKKSKKIDRRLWPHLLIAAYQLQHLSDSVPAYAAVNGAIKNIKGIHPALGGFANAVLRNLGSAPHLQLGKEPSIDQLVDAFGFEPFFIKDVTKSFPQPLWKEVLLGMNERPKRYFRYYGQKDNLKDLPVAPHAFVPGAYFWDKTINPTSSAEDLLKTKVWIAQDPASQVAGLLVSANEGAHVIDLCAAPGTKSMILAKSVSSKGKVTAIDISPRKAELIKENSDRLQIPLEIRVLDATSVPNDLIESADAVLLDAPCSSFGTTRRHPEVKLRQSEENIKALAQLQDQLLDSAALCLKPKGILVYSVCSPLSVEGEERIESFLSRHLNFKREKARDTLPWLLENAQNEKGEIKLWPHLHDSDAFFAARLQKVS